MIEGCTGMPTTKRKAKSGRKRANPKRDSTAIARYKAEAREIAAARQAMERVRREIEFEPERLQYVTDLHMLSGLSS